MAKKGHGGWKKWAKFGTRLIFGVAGGAVAVSPILAAAGETFAPGKDNDPAQFAVRLQRQYGYDPATGAWNPGQMVVKAGVLPLLGIGIAYLGKRIADAMWD